MNNGDMPAAPTSPNDSDPLWAAARSGGLTKREHFAAMAMQGLISNHKECLYEDVAIASTRFADALLAALEAK